jgi:hypothetical protein
MGGLKRISDGTRRTIHWTFPHGELGCYLAVLYHGVDTSNNNNNRVSYREFVTYRFYSKANGYSLLHRATRLFLQWCVKEYVNTEQQKLWFNRHNQANLISDLYQGILDIILYFTVSVITIRNNIVVSYVPSTFSA